VIVHPIQIPESLVGGVMIDVDDDDLFSRKRLSDAVETLPGSRIERDDRVVGRFQIGGLASYLVATGKESIFRSGPSIADDV
jgi:hypothetical protein